MTISRLLHRTEGRLLVAVNPSVELLSMGLNLVAFVPTFHVGRLYNLLLSSRCRYGIP